MPELPVGTWEEFEDQVARLKESNARSLTGLLFRGQSNSDWALETTLERRISNRASSDHLIVENYYNLLSSIQPQVEAFTDRTWNLPSLPAIHKFSTELGELNRKLSVAEIPARDYLVYLRHHGFPSPLLDWTTSPYVACYFAFREINYSDTVSVYVFSETPNNEKGRTSAAPSIYSIGPNISAHKRHFLQQASYTVCVNFEHPKGWRFARHDAVFNQEAGQDELWKIKISSNERAKVLRRLEDYNLNSFSLFGSEESLMETLAIRTIDLATS